MESSIALVAPFPVGKLWPRAIVATGFVAAWVAVGFLLHLGAISYLLLGVPLTVAFQLFIARQPLASLWVRGERFDLGRRLSRARALAVGLAVMPMISLVRTALAHSWTQAAWAVAAAVGAVPAAFAIARLRRADLRALGLCFLTSGLVGIVFMIGSASLVGFAQVPLTTRLWTGTQDFLCFVPVCFVLEEVSFRGALDSYVHPAGGRRDLLSAVFVSALWGVWHLPVVAAKAASADQLAGAAIMLVVVHTLVGVPLSIFWRRTGNLAVPGLVHALIDGVRDALLVRG